MCKTVYLVICYSISTIRILFQSSDNTPATKLYFSSSELGSIVINLPFRRQFTVVSVHSPPERTPKYFFQWLWQWALHVLFLKYVIAFSICHQRQKETHTYNSWCWLCCYLFIPFEPSAISVLHVIYICRYRRMINENGHWQRILS